MKTTVSCVGGGGKTRGCGFRGCVEVDAGVMWYSLKGILAHEERSARMKFEVEYTDEFLAWWETLSEREQISVGHCVGLLEEFGVNLARPYADTLHGSRITNLRELRVQHEGRPYRVLYVFDPRRVAIILTGGDKTGNARWYVEMIPLAEKIYEQYLREIEREVRGGKHGKEV